MWAKAPIPIPKQFIFSSEALFLPPTVYWMCLSGDQLHSGLRPQLFFPFFPIPWAWTKTFHLAVVFLFDRYAIFAFSHALFFPCASGRNGVRGICHHKREEAKDSWPNGISLVDLIHWLSICNVCSYGQPCKDWRNNNGSWHLFESPCVPTAMLNPWINISFDFHKILWGHYYCHHHFMEAEIKWGLEKFHSL